MQGGEQEQQQEQEQVVGCGVLLFRWMVLITTAGIGEKSSEPEEKIRDQTYARKWALVAVLL
jgi:hypothetical protein